MAIAAALQPPKDPNEIAYPVLRRYRDTNASGPMVVLFTAEYKGVCLCGIEPQRLGIQESWHSCLDTDAWEPCTLTLTSLD